MLHSPLNVCTCSSKPDPKFFLYWSYYLGEAEVKIEAEWTPNTMVLMKYFLLDNNCEYVQMLPKIKSGANETCRLEGSGLYMIVAAPNASEDIFEKKMDDFTRWQERREPINADTYNLSKVLPVYIGQTSNLLKRYNQHCKSTKLDQCKELTIKGNENISFKNIHFLCRKMEPATAKFMETIFLHTYDFALNEEEQKMKGRKLLVPLEYEDLYRDSYINKDSKKEADLLYKSSKRMLEKNLKKEDENMRSELSHINKI